MIWNVLRYDVNAQKIEIFNVFNHYNYHQEVKQLLAKHYSYNEFAYWLKRITRYYFWSKCEHEVVVTSWPPHVKKKEVERLAAEDVKYSAYVNLDVAEKIDIYDQLKLNWDAFVEYVMKQESQIEAEEDE